MVWYLILGISLTCMLAYIILLSLAQSQIIQYGFDEYDCTTTPTTMLLYESFLNSSTMNWYVNDLSPWLELCADIETTEGFSCCRNSFFKETLPYAEYRAWSTDTSEADIPNSNGPMGANGQNYCQLYNNGSSLSFIKGLFLDNGNCLQDYFKCYDNGNTLEIFEEAKCNGPSMKFTLTNTAQNVNTRLGEFTLQKAASLSYFGTSQWSTFYPPGMVIPIHRYAVEYVGTVFYVFTILWIIFAFAQFTLSFYTGRLNALSSLKLKANSNLPISPFKRSGLTEEYSETTPTGPTPTATRKTKRMQLIFMFLFGFWLVHFTLDFVLWYVILDPEDHFSYFLVAAVLSISKALGMYLTVFINVQIVIQIFFNSSEYYNFIYYGLNSLLLALHIGINGWAYLIDMAYDTSWIFPILEWSDIMKGVWTAVFFTIDTFVPILVLYKIWSLCPNRSSRLQNLQKAFQQRKFAVLFFGQILITILYQILVRAVMESSRLGNDFAYYLVHALSSFLFTAHVYLSAVGYEFHRDFALNFINLISSPEEFPNSDDGDATGQLQLDIKD